MIKNLDKIINDKKYEKIRVVLYVIGLISVFLCGMWWQNFIYTDVCLDMGGKLTSGNYPVCVLEPINK